jgi:hypothetical protein
MDYKELANAIADYEYYATGMKHMGLAHADVEIISIDQPEDIEPEDEIEIHAEVTLHTEDKSETYHDCTYSLSDMMQRALSLREAKANAQLTKSGKKGHK